MSTEEQVKKPSLNASAREWKPTTTTGTPFVAPQTPTTGPTFVPQQPQMMMAPMYYYPYQPFPTQTFPTPMMMIHPGVNPNPNPPMSTTPAATLKKLSAGAPTWTPPVSVPTQTITTNETSTVIPDKEIVEPSSTTLTFGSFGEETSTTPATIPSTTSIPIPPPLIIDSEKSTTEILSEEKETNVTIDTSTPNGNNGKWIAGSALVDEGEWRSTSNNEKTAAQMLLRNDGVKRYSKTTLVSLCLKGKICPTELMNQYSKLSEVERTPLVTLHLPNSPHNRSPRRDKNNNGQITRGQQVPDRDRDKHQEDQPHPDEAIIFSAENLNREDTFKHKPSAIVSKTDPAYVTKNGTLILNQLSVEKFEKLSAKFLQILLEVEGWTVEGVMQKASDMIVLVSQENESMCFLYAKLCQMLVTHYTEQSQVAVNVPSTVTPTTEEETQNLSLLFKSTLLKRCQEEFTRDREVALNAIRTSTIIPDDEKDERILIEKKKQLAFIRFVGELFMTDLVSAKIMFHCMDTLLDSMEEEKLMCLCKLVATIGNKLDEKDKKDKKPKLNSYFIKLTEITDTQPSPISSRVRFALLDLIDMRKNKWISRRVEEKAKKLSEFRATVDTSGNGTPNNGPNSNGKPFTPSNTNRGSNSNLVNQTQDVRKLASSTSGGGNGNGEEGWTNVPKKKASAPPSKGGNTNTTTNGIVATAGKFSALASEKTPTSIKQKKHKNEKFPPKLQTELSVNSLASSESFNQTEDLEIEVDLDLMDMEPLDTPTNSLLEVNDKGEWITSEENIKKIITGAAEEFMDTLLLNEASNRLSSLISSTSMWGMISSSMLMSFEKKTDEHNRYLGYLPGLYSIGLLTKDDLYRGISLLLHEFDDLVMDVPLISKYVANILAYLCMNIEYLPFPYADQDQLTLTSDIPFDSLRFILLLPEDNNFSMSMSLMSLLIQTISIVELTAGISVATSLANSTFINDDIFQLSSFQIEGIKSSLEKIHCEAMKDISF